MSTAARSIMVFGIYCAVMGLWLLFLPNVLLKIFGFPETSEPWIRVMACLVLGISYYYIQAARHELTTFFRFTVQARPAVLVAFSALVIFGVVQPMLILFGAIDLAGGIWTALALRSSGSAESPQKPS